MSLIGLAIAQVVIHQPVTAKAQVSLCGICGGQSCTGTGLSLKSLVFPFQYHSNVAPYSYITWEMNNKPICGCSVETWSLPIDMNDGNNKCHLFILSFILSTCTKLFHFCYCRGALNIANFNHVIRFKHDIY
jgi:hypothetical protein